VGTLLFFKVTCQCLWEGVERRIEVLDSVRLDSHTE
jgi:hypothetical protein